MRITVDAVPLLVRSAGVKNYLFHWIVHLRRLLGDEHVRLFPFLDNLPDLNHEESAVDPPGTLARQGLLYALNLWPNHAWDWIGPPCDIFHATKLRNPPRRARLSSTLHDMTCWLMPELHQASNVVAEQCFAERIWKHCDGLIAVSESTRRDAIRILGLKPDAIQVIYPGIAQPYFDVATEAVQSVRHKYRLGRPYVLYIGTVEPRKNLDRLLNAWQAVPASLREEFELVAAGPAGWQSSATLARLREPSSARYLAYVPEADLPGLTAGAAVFVYPSLYEGFGFPVVQSMAAGVPVLTSNISSLPEITGGAALLIDPKSTDEISTGLHRLLTSPSLRDKLSQTGRSQATGFRWDTSARHSVDFFEKILTRV
jgi:alpha-1,3-rhamnosyl/mannosyltransferase